jgi:hypothetical protein
MIVPGKVSAILKKEQLVQIYLHSYCTDKANLISMRRIHIRDMFIRISGAVILCL